MSIENTTQKMQESFNKWAEDNGYKTTLRDTRDSSGDTYFSYETEQRWIVWQAAQAAKPTPHADDVANMASLIRQMASSLKRAKPESELPRRAVEYLQRKNLLGSPLRAASEPKPVFAEKVVCARCKGTTETSVRQAIEEGEHKCSDCNGKGYDWEPVEEPDITADQLVAIKRASHVCEMAGRPDLQADLRMLIEQNTCLPLDLLQQAALVQAMFTCFSAGHDVLAQQLLSIAQQASGVCPDKLLSIATVPPGYKLMPLTLYNGQLQSAAQAVREALAAKTGDCMHIVRMTYAAIVGHTDSPAIGASDAF